MQSSSGSIRRPARRTDCGSISRPSGTINSPPWSLLEQARLDIIINFEHLKHATPEALKALLDGGAVKEVLPYAKVRYQKFRAAFEDALHGLSVSGIDFLSEDFQDA